MGKTAYSRRELPPLHDSLHQYDLYGEYDDHLYVKYVKYVDIRHQKPRFLPLSPTGRHGYV
jgi:hypothetical protein